MKQFKLWMLLVAVPFTGMAQELKGDAQIPFDAGTLRCDPFDRARARAGRLCPRHVQGQHVEREVRHVQVRQGHEKGRYEEGRHEERQHGQEKR